jgi:hypothetical protein
MTQADRLVGLAVGTAPGPVPIDVILANATIDGLLSSSLADLLGDERADAADALLRGFGEWCERRAARVVTKSNRARFTEAEEATVLSRLFFLSATDGVIGVESRRALATQFEGWAEMADPDRVKDEKNHGKLWQSYVRLLAVYLNEPRANRTELQPAVLEPLTGRSLPRPHAHFVGRAKALSQLGAAGDGSVLLVTGPPAIGKTTLLAYWASTAAEQFPDGQVYLDMRGYGDDAAIEGADGLRAVLLAAGALTEKDAHSHAELERLGHETFAARSLLVVLDNVAHVGQVEPFMTGGGRTAIVVGSRSTLEELVVRFGAMSVRVEPFTPDEARNYFLSSLGVRAQTEVDDLDSISFTCGYWPLALALVASKLSVHANLSVSAVAKALTDQRSVLDQTLGNGGTTPLRAAFEWSFASLPPDIATVFAGLSTVPSRTISHSLAKWIAEARVLGFAELDGTAVSRTPGEWRQLESTVAIELGRLAAESLLEVYENGSYGFHLLIREFAQEKAEEIRRRTSLGQDEDEDEEPPYEAIVAFGYYSTRSLNVMLYETQVDLGEGPMAASDYVDRAWLDDEAGNALQALNWAYFEADLPLDIDVVSLIWLLADFYLSRGDFRAATDATFIGALLLQEAAQTTPSEGEGEGESTDDDDLGTLQAVYDRVTWRLGLVALQAGPSSYAAEYLDKLGDHDGQMVLDILDILGTVDSPGIRNDPLSTVRRIEDFVSTLSEENQSEAWSIALQIAHIQAASAAAEHRTELARRIFLAVRGAVTRHSLLDNADLIEAILLGYIGAANIEESQLADELWGKAQQLAEQWGKSGLCDEIRRARPSSAWIRRAD